MNNHFLVKTLIKCFGETTTINMLNQLQKGKVNRKAKKYRASLDKFASTYSTAALTK